MKSIFLIVLSILLLSPAVFAQTKIEINTPDAEVVVDGGKTTIKTKNVKLQTQKGKKKKSGATTLYIGDSKKLLTNITCSKNQTLKFDKVGSKVVVKASGNCDLTLKNVSIKGSKIALHISGNASVTLVDCSVVNPTKKGIAIRIDGNGSLTTKNTKVRGKVKLSKNASYKKRK